MKPPIAAWMKEAINKCAINCGEITSDEVEAIARRHNILNCRRSQLMCTLRKNRHIRVEVLRTRRMMSFNNRYLAHVYRITETTGVGSR